MLEGKSMPSNMAADTNHANFVVKSKYHKIFPLNEFPLKFRVQDNSVNFWHQQFNSLFKGSIGHVTS